MINYYDVMKIGYELLKEDVDLVYGIDVKDQAESAIHIAGVVDTVYKLREMFEETETEKDD